MEVKLEFRNGLFLRLKIDLFSSFCNDSAWYYSVWHSFRVISDRFLNNVIIQIQSSLKLSILRIFDSSNQPSYKLLLTINEGNDSEIWESITCSHQCSSTLILFDFFDVVNVKTKNSFLRKWKFWNFQTQTLEYSRAKRDLKETGLKSLEFKVGKEFGFTIL